MFHVEHSSQHWITTRSGPRQHGGLPGWSQEPATGTCGPPSTRQTLKISCEKCPEPKPRNEVFHVEHFAALRQASLLPAFLSPKPSSYSLVGRSSSSGSVICGIFVAFARECSTWNTSHVEHFQRLRRNGLAIVVTGAGAQRKTPNWRSEKAFRSFRQLGPRDPAAVRHVVGDSCFQPIREG